MSSVRFAKKCLLIRGASGVTKKASTRSIEHSGILPTEHAFRGTLKNCEIAVGAIDLDLLHVVHIKQQEIVNNVRLSVKQHSQRVQFSSKIQLKKLPKDEDEFLSSQADCISVFVSSKIERVDYGDLADKNFHGMVKQMLLFLKNFCFT